jgi:hypothetical protein
VNSIDTGFFKEECFIPKINKHFPEFKQRGCHEVGAAQVSLLTKKTINSWYVMHTFSFKCLKQYFVLVKEEGTDCQTIIEDLTLLFELNSLLQ